MTLMELLDLLDESIEYWESEADDFLKTCLKEQRRGQDGDFSYQCYLVNSGRADGLREFREELKEMLDGKTFDEGEFLRRFTSEA